MKWPKSVYSIIKPKLISTIFLGTKQYQIALICDPLHEADTTEYAMPPIVKHTMMIGVGTANVDDYTNTVNIVITLYKHLVSSRSLAVVCFMMYVS